MVLDEPSNDKRWSTSRGGGGQGLLHDAGSGTSTQWVASYFRDGPAGSLGGSAGERGGRANDQAAPDNGRSV